MNCPTCPHPLIQEEKDIISQIRHIYDECSRGQAQLQRQIYSDATVVQAQWKFRGKSIQDFSISQRSLTNLTPERPNFISRNGTHSLVATKLVNDTLGLYFGKDWHFLPSTSSHFTSKVVYRHFKEARNIQNYLVQL